MGMPVCAPLDLPLFCGKVEVMPLGPSDGRDLTGFPSDSIPSNALIGKCGSDSGMNKPPSGARPDAIAALSETDFVSPRVLTKFTAANSRPAR